MTTREASVVARRRLGDWNVGEGRVSSGGRSAIARPAADGPRMDPRMRQRGVDVRDARWRRRTQVTAVVAAFVTVALAAVGLMHTGLLGVRRERVVGHHPGTAAALLAEVGLRHGEPLIDVDSSSVAARLDDLPWVAVAQVHRDWPDGVTVTVGDRQPVAQIPIGSSPAGPVATVDVTGRMLGRRSVADVDLPVLTGVGVPGATGSWLAGSTGFGFRPGSVPTQPRPASRSLAAAAGRVEAALAVTAGIAAFGHGGTFGPARSRVTQVTAGADRGLEATVMPGAVTVVIGSSTQLAAKVTALVSMLDAVRLPAGSTLDLQVPDRPTVTPAAA